MTQREINISFDYVVKCIDSCSHELHTEVVYKLMDNFYDKTSDIGLYHYLSERLRMKIESFMPVYNPIDNFNKY